MTLVLLVRHALTEATGRVLTGHQPGFHLDERGRAQAAALAERMAPVPLAAVYASPLERCTETADAIAGPRGLDVRTDPALIEVGYGEWAGKTFRQLLRRSLWKTIRETPSRVRFPGGETFAEVQARAAAAVDRIAAAHRGRAVAVCTHADVIRLLLAHYAGVHLDLFQRTIVSPASVSALALGDHPPRVLRVNDTGGLADLAPAKRPSGR